MRTWSIVLAVLVIAPLARAGQWVDAADGDHPDGAFAAGERDGDRVVLCRAQRDDVWEPGALDDEGCQIAVDGKSRRVHRYQVYVGAERAQWTPGADGARPPDAFVVGTGENGQPLAVCRVRRHGDTEVGRLGRDACVVARGHRLERESEYDVLSFAFAPTEPVASGPSWVPAREGDVPAGAFAAGREHDRPLYLCRTRKDEREQLGKVVDGRCSFASRDGEDSAAGYEVLVGVAGERWMPASAGDVPPGAFVAGQLRDDRPLTVCRARYAHGLQPGKVTREGCRFAFGGENRKADEYEVLAVPTYAPPPAVAVAPPPPPPPPVVVAPPPPPMPPPVAGAHWIPAKPGFIPPNAFAAGAGAQGEPTFLCRTRAGDGVHVGEIVGLDCRVGFGGGVAANREYEELVDATREQWMPATQGAVPAGAFLAANVRGRALAVCRAHFDHGLHPGEVDGRGCRFASGGREITTPAYDVLVVSEPMRFVPVAVERWVPSSNGEVPPNAFAAGEEDGRPLYLCRARAGDGVHPGKVVGTNCNVPFRGRELTVPVYEVLTGVTSASWFGAAAGQRPSGAFVGGDMDGRPLPVCRARYGRGVHPGQLLANGCHFGYGGNAVTSASYEVLVAPPAP